MQNTVFRSEGLRFLKDSAMERTAVTLLAKNNKLFKEEFVLKDDPHDTDRNMLLNLIKSCGKEKNVWKMRRIHEAVVSKNLIRRDIYIATAMITTYVECGMLEKAQQVFEELPVRDVVSWNALITGYARHGRIDEALKCLRNMQISAIRPDVGSYIPILKSCGASRSLEIGKYIDVEVRKQGLLEKDVMVGNALVSMYSKCGDLVKANEVFKQLPNRNVVSWNALITGYTQHGFGNEALKWFRKMQSERVCPDVVTYICVLQACGIVGSLEVGKDIHVEVRKQGLLQKSVVLGTALVDMYSKCGALEKAREVFEQLPMCNIVTWNVLITGYTQHGLADQAIKYFTKMKNEGVCPNEVTYISILKACALVGSLQIGEHIHAEVRKKGLLQKELVLGTALVDMYCKCCALDKAQDVFEQLPVRDVVTWNALIGGYVQHGFNDEALKCFRKMLDEGVSPQAVTYICILKACGNAGFLEIGEDIDAKIRQQGLLQNIVLGTALVDMYCKCGALAKAQEVFEQLPRKDIVAWNALVTGYAQRGLGDQVLKYFKQMEDENIHPNTVTYICALKACGIIGALKIGEDIHVKVSEQGLLQKDVVLGNTLVDMYFKCSMLEKAREVFEQIPKQDVVSWNAIITGYSQCGLSDEALECFREMKTRGISPDAVTYICVLKACGIVGSLQIGEDIDAEIRKRGLLFKDVVLGTALVDMYCRCGALEKAQETFEQLPVRNLVPWNALMAGYAQFGQSDVVLHLYRKARMDGIVPNLVTFVVMLSACSHAGLLKEGDNLFDEMCGVYHLAPALEHYTCMIDLFGRSGCFNKVNTLLDKVSYSGYLPLFLSVLGACRKWRNVKLGRWAFEQALRLDAKCGVAYVGMENIYVAAAMHKEADGIEVLREE